MCGIVGFLVGAPRSAPDLEHVLTRLAGLEAKGDSPEEFEAIGREAEALSLSLIRPEGFRFLLREGVESPGIAQALGNVDRLLETAEKGASSPGASLPVAEAWNASAVRFRDVSWRLRKDLLQNLPLTVALCGSRHVQDGLDGTAALDHAFKLNLVLNSMDRLEVRGRDSAGIGTVVWFPDAASREAWLARVEGEGLLKSLQERRQLPDFVHGTVLESGGDRPALVFAHKTAEEIGRLGQNVARLREALSSDGLYWLAVGWPGASAELLAHTRWASNGIVNEPNCHPVDDRCEGDNGDVRFLAVLNGDIDNYQALLERTKEGGARLPSGITTDAKIIPVMIAEKYRETGDVGEAFRLAMDAFDGAFAIALLSTAEPGVVRLALKGAGQALYVGESEAGLMFASETYGLVEACNRYVRMDGEKPREEGNRDTAGQMLRLTGASAFPDDLALLSFDGRPVAGLPTVFDAEITTRDIHRGSFDHFFLKEITEAPDSFEKTIRGRFTVEGRSGEETPVFAFGPETVPEAVVERLRAGSIRRALFIGQGTASVAAGGIARLWEDILVRSDLACSAVKASELSGFGLSRDMSDTLVVAVSQSGTTTDTNRTVELVKSRGASVLAIVNRRHSDLAHRADGVVYTGDGRDVEMAVASTKAFYTQVAAGYLLGLYIAHVLRSVPVEEVTRRLRGLARMPDLMREVLLRRDGIRSLAEEHAVRKRHWAAVGSGLDLVAAEEIRIKLSELNYKSISCDFLEDKKHIDLSAEPLILVCAVSQPPGNVPDAVKEVSIFKAHRATPLVIVPDGENRYGAYASGLIHVPVGVPELAFLLETMAGHLWGYDAARAIDAGGNVLREARSVVVQALTPIRKYSGSALGSALRLLRNRLASPAREFARRLRAGLFNSGLEVETAVRLQTLFGYLMGHFPLRDLQRDFGGRATWDALLDHFLHAVSQAIGELTRPIDAIKHQAKTVTVGVSREEIRPSGPLFDVMKASSFPADSLADAERYVLEAVSRAVAEVPGFTLYRLTGLNEMGSPGEDTAIRVLRQGGEAENLPSRASLERPLFGTKRRAASRGRICVGSGRADHRPIIIVPGAPEDGEALMLLIHVRYRDDLTLEDTLHVLRGYYERYEEIRWAASEVDPNFHDKTLEGIPILSLLEDDLNTVLTRIRDANPARGS